MAAKGKAGRVRFLGTRVAVGAGAIAMFLGFWGAVAATEDEGKGAAAEPEKWVEAPAVEEEIIQDGWRWDKATGQWVAIEPAAAQATAEAVPARQVVVIEQRPVYYVTQYFPVPANSGGTGATPVSGQTPRSDPTAVPGSATPGTAGQPAPGAPLPGDTIGPYTPPDPAPSSPQPAPSAPPAAAPPAAVPAAAPAVPAPAPAAPPPPPAPAPPPPPPPPAATTAPKTSKGS